MYNTKLFKSRKDGRIDMAMHGNLAKELMGLRFDHYDEEDVFERFEIELSKREVEGAIEYLQEFLRLLENKR